ncbi:MULTISPECIES: PAS domain S-box protein [unclassified Leptolyngbya]|uniref:sensor histidine kinase n=1 Tax=unclassified Leptolyngbya TaxID=2650499 RepID=UPI0016830435|nr:MULTISPECIES: PAS domain S-box protein [unclassified Leptolyngbya]MBD1913563.1 PAS domain S-box protein [Leptolyngbya sp. FACHB-8]MBD2155866.1 PAS domain S-box protein [Leptolyngbya sp. FACHB-16]
MQERPSQLSSDRSFLALFQTAFDPMLLVDQEGHCIAANPAAYALFGWPSDDSRPHNLETLFVESPLLWQVGTPQELPQSGRGQIRCVDGRCQWVMYRVSAVDPSDPLQHYLIILRETSIAVEPQPLPQPSLQPSATTTRPPTTPPDTDWWFRSAFEQSIQLASLLSPDGRLLVDNQTALDFCQLTPQEFIGRPFVELDCWQLSSEIQNRLLAAIATAASGEPVRYETNILAPDRSVITIDFSLKPIRNPAGQIEFLLAEGLNITSQKQIEEALRQSETLFSVAFHANPEPMTISTLEGDRLFEVNEQFCQITGYQRDDVIGRRIPELNLWQTAEARTQMLEALQESGRLSNYEATLRMQSGELRVGLLSAHIVEVNQQLCILSTIKDITERKQAEAALHDAEAHLEDILNNSAAYITRIWLYADRTWEYDYVSATCERLYGYTAAEIQADQNLWRSRIFLEDMEQVLVPNTERILAGSTEVTMEYRFRHRDGSIRWISENSVVRYDEHRQGWLLTIVAIDITERKQVEALVKQQQERERLLTATVQQIRKSLNLQDVLTTAAQEVQQLLEADRTLIYRFNPDWSGKIVVESVQEPWQSVLGTTVYDPCFRAELVEPYRQGRIHAVSDLLQEQLSPCHQGLLAPFQIRAHLVIPILCGDRLWGLFCIHQCSDARTWLPFEVELLQQLCERLAIAIQQSELYQQVQHLNAELEHQVHERTLALEQSLRFEALLRQLTTQMRDNLDEQHILQTAVDGLGRELGVLCCDVGMYDPEHSTVTIKWEYNPGLEALQNAQFSIAESGDPDIYYRHLLNRESVQVCPLNYTSVRPGMNACTTLICPIMDDQGVLGDMWLVRPADQYFEEVELQLVQQVASQCAIALRQAHLYHLAQTQVGELERLNQLKDDFLSTVSHELRTPMANIKMATEMVELRLIQRNILGDGNDPALERYFHILKDACNREIRLIDDLLDLTRLNSDIEPIIPFQIHLRPWVFHIAEAFRDRILRKEQILQIDINDDLVLETDLAYLERIVMELLNNACKYTPTGEGIFISGRLVDQQLQLVFANSGVDLPPEECDRIFGQFYRIPSSDPWQHEGTGLGLALVRKLTEKLGGSIRAESSQQHLRIILTFPYP